MGPGRAVSRPLSLRPPAPGEIPAARRLHVAELGWPPGADDHRTQGRSVERYHRAFAESPHAAAIVAVEDREARVVGFLLGSLDAPAHRAFVLRRHGARLAVQLALRALAGAVGGPVAGEWPAWGRGSEPGAGPPRAPLGGLSLLDPPTIRERERATRTGDLACVVVDGRWRGLGVGAALVRAYEAQARRAGLEGLFAAAPERRTEAAAFLARLGWHPEFVPAEGATSGVGGRATASSAATLYARRLPAPATGGPPRHTGGS